MIALLGREPGGTDGVRDYCERLSQALGAAGRELRLERVPWDRSGVRQSLRDLLRNSVGWRGDWVLLQYTAFGWSHTGIPVLPLLVGVAARRRGGRLAVVFHDSQPHAARGPVGLMRRWGQTAAMWGLHQQSDQAFVTIPLRAARWLCRGRNAVTVPVGSNVAPAGYIAARSRREDRQDAVVVFGVTGGSSTRHEVTIIGDTLAAVRERAPSTRVVFVGCGTHEAASLIRGQIPAPCEVHGVLEAPEVHGILEKSAAALFVRGPVANGRTTAVSAVVAGTPLVGFEGPTTGDPIASAGVCLVPMGQPHLLAQALEKVLSDAVLWTRLHVLSLKAAEESFSWTAIAQRVSRALPE